jgi:transketolase
MIKDEINDNCISLLEHKANLYRRRCLTMVRRTGAGHLGGDLSCIDILNILYNHVMNISPETWECGDRDRYLHSKGHSAEALYVVLADIGFFPDKLLDTAESFGSIFAGHPVKTVPGVEHNTGSLGHGLSVALGIALAYRKDGKAGSVFILLGDGELAEGSNWEAAMAAAHYGLDNIIAVVDRNRLQISGTTEDVCTLEPLEKKWKSFGWEVRRTDGHDYRRMAACFAALPFKQGRPNLILAETVKGRGVSFMENQASWHHRVPTDSEYTSALRELQR